MIAQSSCISASQKGSEWVSFSSSLVFLKMFGIKNGCFLKAKIVAMLLHEIMGYQDLIE